MCECSTSAKLPSFSCVGSDKQYSFCRTQDTISVEPDTPLFAICAPFACRKEGEGLCKTDITAVRREIPTLEQDPLSRRTRLYPHRASRRYRHHSDSC